jgi:hypothetical protein
MPAIVVALAVFHPAMLTSKPDAEENVLDSWTTLATFQLPTGIFDAPQPLNVNARFVALATFQSPMDESDSAEGLQENMNAIVLTLATFHLPRSSATVLWLNSDAMLDTVAVFHALIGP